MTRKCSKCRREIIGHPGRHGPSCNLEPMDPDAEPTEQTEQENATETVNEAPLDLTETINAETPSTETIVTNQAVPTQLNVEQVLQNIGQTQANILDNPVIAGLLNQV